MVVVVVVVVVAAVAAVVEAAVEVVSEGWRRRVGVRGTWVGASSMVVSDESLLVDGERVRGVEVREAMAAVVVVVVGWYWWWY